MRQRNGMIGLLLLFTTALIWGGSFVAQKLGMDHIGPFPRKLVPPADGGDENQKDKS